MGVHFPIRYQTFNGRTKNKKKNKVRFSDKNGLLRYAHVCRELAGAGKEGDGYREGGDLSGRKNKTRDDTAGR